MRKDQQPGAFSKARLHQCSPQAGIAALSPLPGRPQRRADTAACNEGFPDLEPLPTLPVSAPFATKLLTVGKEQVRRPAPHSCFRVGGLG